VAGPGGPPDDRQSRAIESSKTALRAASDCDIMAVATCDQGKGTPSNRLPIVAGSGTRAKISQPKVTIGYQG
jgi:hypothetical protein